MQDFIKLDKATNANPTLPQAREKWLNKDRIWTLVFWFGMSFGIAVSFNLKKVNALPPTFSYCLFWLTLIGVPLILNIFNSTKFIKTLTFANREGRILTEEQRPYLFGWAIAAGLPAAFAVAEIIFPKNAEHFIFTFIGLIVFLAPMSLYFLCKNCPISILFNRKFWTIDGSPSVAWLKKLNKIIKED